MLSINVMTFKYASGGLTLKNYEYTIMFVIVDNNF